MLSTKRLEELVPDRDKGDRSPCKWKPGLLPGGQWGMLKSTIFLRGCRKRVKAPVQQLNANLSYIVN